MFKWINKLKNKKGFTLIELIVVLAVLGIIALIAIPRFLGVQAQAKFDADLGTAAGMAKAAELYYVQTPSIQGTGDIDIPIQDLIDSAYLDEWDGNWQSTDTSGVTITVNSSSGSVTVDGPGDIDYP